MRNQKGFTIIELMIILAILLILAVVAGSSMGIFNPQPGTGQKIGQVVKVGKQGIFRKTWEAQLIRGGMSGGSGSFGTVPFDFTVEDDMMAAQVEEFMRSQSEVVITYETEGVYLPLRSSSHGNFLKNIAIAPLRK
jgi:prepilin-type N-terminal cleavage/methylation domain-containing protein